MEMSRRGCLFLALSCLLAALRFVSGIKGKPEMLGPDMPVSQRQIAATAKPECWVLRLAKMLKSVRLFFNLTADFVEALAFEAPLPGSRQRGVVVSECLEGLDCGV